MEKMPQRRKTPEAQPSALERLEHGSFNDEQKREALAVLRGEKETGTTNFPNHVGTDEAAADYKTILDTLGLEVRESFVNDARIARRVMEITKKAA